MPNGNHCEPCNDKHRQLKRKLATPKKLEITRITGNINIQQHQTTAIVALFETHD